MNIQLDGKKALVTGAGKGIGRAISKNLVDCGAEVYALSRTVGDLESLQKELPGIHIIPVDLSDWDKTRNEVDKVECLDILVNNAGIVEIKEFLEETKENLDSMFDINLKAVFNISQVVAKKMVDRKKGGTIVNISSTCSKKAHKGCSVYCTTKAALDMLTKCMALELGPHQIRVNAVNPTIVWTDMALTVREYIETLPDLALTPLGRFAEVEEVVNAVMFLLSDKSGMISGESLLVDGGLCAH